MVEKQIEDALIAGLESALGTLSHYTTGAWQFAAALEETDEPAVLDVRVQPRAYEIETTPCASFSATVRLVFRREQEEGEEDALLPYLEALAARLDLWQGDYDTASEALSGDGFELAGFLMSGGDFGLDESKSAFVWEQNLTIRGTIL